MTVKDLCEKYNCDYSSIYRKIKRHRGKLEGHIDSSKPVIELDEYAAELLIPRKILEQDQHNDELAELRTSLLNEKMKVSKYKSELNEESEKRRSAEIENDELNRKLKSTERIIADNEKSISELNEKVKKLETENDELRKNQKKKLF